MMAVQLERSQRTVYIKEHWISHHYIAENYLVFLYFTSLYSLCYSRIFRLSMIQHLLKSMMNDDQIWSLYDHI
jgi:hypothetical protein